MDDLINRQAAIEACLRYNGVGWVWSKILDEIEKLPSAQPDLQPTCNQLATDCISRHAAIDAVDNYIGTFDAIDVNFLDGLKTAKKLMMQLPSAQPTQLNTPNTLEALDCISRQAAYEVLTAYYHQKTDIQHAALHDALSKVPTMRARWEYVDYGGVGNWHCSVCRAISHKRTNFCPACGRDMRGDYQ